MLMHDPPHPGGVIRRQCLEPLGLTVTEAVRGLAVSRNTLFMLLNGRRGISPERFPGLRRMGLRPPRRMDRILRKTRTRRDAARPPSVPRHTTPIPHRTRCVNPVGAPGRLGIGPVLCQDRPDSIFRQMRSERVGRQEYAAARKREACPVSRDAGPVRTAPKTSPCSKTTERGAVSGCVRRKRSCASPASARSTRRG